MNTKKIEKISTKLKKFNEELKQAADDTISKATERQILNATIYLMRAIEELDDCLKIKPENDL